MKGDRRRGETRRERCSRRREWYSNVKREVFFGDNSHAILYLVS